MSVTIPDPQRGTVRKVTPLRILVVEDNGANRMLARRFLEEDGHGVDFAVDGEEATRRVIGHESDFDVILMDIQMPVMGGLEAAKLILGSNPSMPKPPIFALTANVMREQVEEYKRVGMKGVVGKPFRRSEIRALLARIGNAGHTVEKTVEQTVEPAEASFMNDDDGIRISCDLLLEAARVMTGGNVAQLCDLVDEQATRLLKELTEAAGDPEIVTSRAHEIAGMLNNFGFKQASCQAGALEIAARNGEQTSAMVEALDAAVRGDLDSVKKDFGNVGA